MEQAMDKEALWTTRDAAAFLNTSARKLEISRMRGDGPPFIKISARMVRYSPADVRAWVSSIRCTGKPVHSVLHSAEA